MGMDAKKDGGNEKCLKGKKNFSEKKSFTVKIY